MKTLLKTLLLFGLLPLFWGCASDATSAKDGSTRADSAAADGGSVTLIDNQGLIDACVRATACGIKVYPGIANCVDAYRSLFVERGNGAVMSEVYRCVNAAKNDCAAMSKCFDARGACDQTFQARCEGTIALSCDLIDKRVYGVDCKYAGRICHVGSASTITASCTPAACDSSFTAYCQGNTLFKCAGGIVETSDCTKDGLRCLVRKDDKAGCAGTGETVCNSNEISPECEGASVVVDCIFNRIHRYDCSAEGKTCQGGSCVGGSTPDCGNDLRAQCENGKLKSCVDGKYEIIDCAALGLKPCIVPDGKDWARCDS
ncbi:MAG: hypothetical protein H6707_13355 [Deltaproteobacteria bacterium]|nr:hypothetical protein [Deltaproteobacteria bacterium]